MGLKRQVSGFGLLLCESGSGVEKWDFERQTFKLFSASKYCNLCIYSGFPSCPKVLCFSPAGISYQVCLKYFSGYSSPFVDRVIKCIF